MSEPTQGTAAAEDDAQEPEKLQVDTAQEAQSPPSAADRGLTAKQLAVLFRLLRVAYPHDRFPDAPYQRTAAQVEAAAGADAQDLVALAKGLDDLGDGFLDLDEQAATAELKKIETESFFRQIHSTAVVALYDDREVWDLLGYEGSSFEKGGYLERGFDDLDWLPDARITELDEPRIELVADGDRS